MRILGIDPGIGTTGWSILAKSAQKTELVAAGIITTNVKDIHAQRLVSLQCEIQCLIDTYQPEQLSIEKLFFAKNVTTAMRVSEARGVILVTACANSLTIHEYTPLQVKLSITGYGQASKRQVIDMLRHHLPGIALPNQDDAADAVAIALTHCSSTLLKPHEAHQAR